MKNLAEDWITIWQSECNAAARDPERLAAWAMAVRLWADGARHAVALWPAAYRGADAAPGSSPPQPKARPAAADAAPDARDIAIDRLAQRVDELERRLAASGNAEA